MGWVERVTSPSISVREAAARLEVAEGTIRRWAKVGLLPLESGSARRMELDEEDLRLAESLRNRASKLNGSANSLLEEPRSVASLFSGIGGFDLGFERAGFKSAFQCESSPFCLDVLAHHWPKTPRWDDIKELSGEDIPLSDVWAAGFPCQDVSLARMGQRSGLQGKNSGLFYEFARLVDEARPKVVLLENVHGLLNSHRGKDFGIILSTLAQLGYCVGWRVLNSQYFGVPQSRKRIYIVGCHRDQAGPGSILFEPECSTGSDSPNRPNGKKPISPFKRVIGNPRKGGPVTQAIAYCLYACSARHTGTDWSRTYVSYPKRGEVRRLTPRECEGVMSFPEDWTIPHSRFGDIDTVDGLRYHALGNAVTPPVPAWIAGRISAYLDAAKSSDSTSALLPTSTG